MFLEQRLDGCMLEPRRHEVSAVTEAGTGRKKKARAGSDITQMSVNETHLSWKREEGRLKGEQKRLKQTKQSEGRK